jgi:hypothetical protein
VEGIDQDRWARLIEAARRVSGGPVSTRGRDAVRLEVERSGRSAATSRGGTWPLIARVVGALAVLAIGAVHLQQYEMLYSAIPTIGTLFVLNFAAATVVGLGLLAPLETVFGGRWGGAAVGLLTLAGVALAATSFAFLAISEHTPLFGFMEPGYDPTAILASRVAEAVTIVSLGTYGIARVVVGVSGRRW